MIMFTSNPELNGSHEDKSTTSSSMLGQHWQAYIPWVGDFLEDCFMHFCVKLRTDFPTEMQLIVLELLFEVASRFNCANFPTVY